MSDNEIIKALECCSKHHNTCGTCCPMDSICNNVRDCLMTLSKNTLDLINRQQAEIERLNSLVEDLNAFFPTCTDCELKIESPYSTRCLRSINNTYCSERGLKNILKTQEENQKLKTEIERFKRRIGEQKHALFEQQAYTAELQNKITTAKSEAIKEFAEKLKKKTYSFPCAIGVENAVTIRVIDDLVKEMTEVNENDRYRDIKK